MFGLFKKKKNKFVNANIAALDIIPATYELTDTEEKKNNAWKEIGRIIKNNVKVNNAKTYISPDIYGSIPFEELVDTLKIQGYRLEGSFGKKFTKNDYNGGHCLYIYWR